MDSERHTILAGSRQAPLGVVATLALLGLLVASRPAAASGKLDIRSWLNRPGVKVVAVEFYATWCKPCMEAVPRWKALHEKYYDDGFRLIVVNTLDPGGGCAQVPWNPDERICDDDGFIGNSFGIGGNLPSAFVWTWQGNLLVRKGHIELAEKEIARYLAKNPRVAVEAYSGGNKPDELLELAVRGEVQMTGKFDVVVGEAEREKLKKLRKASHRMGVRDDQRCKIGAALSANALLVAKLLGSGRSQKLSLALNSAETGCLLASTYVSYSERRRGQAVREAVAALTSKLRREPEHPKGGTFGGRRRSVRRPEVKEGKIGGEDAGDWDPSAGASQQVVVKFRSNPSGAVVLVDGRLICKSTPCSKALEPGRYNVDMQLDAYVPGKEVVDIKGNRTIAWTLKPDFAVVTVNTTPRKLAVNVDGKELRGGALRNMRLSPGPHNVVIDNRCYPKTGQRIVVKRGETRTLSFAPKPRPSAIRVMAEDDKGNVLEAKVRVDGKLLEGTTPRTYRVPVCSKEVKVEAEGKAPYTQRLSLEEKKVFDIHAKLPTGVKIPGYARVTVRAPSGVPVRIDGALVSRYKRKRYRVRAGATRITVRDKCYEPYAKQVFLKPGSFATVDVKPTPLMAQVDIKAADDKGAPLAGALVFVDSRYVGKAPGTLDVPACGRSLEVHADGKKPFTYKMSLRAGQSRALTAKLQEETNAYRINRQNRKIAGWMRRAGKTYTYATRSTGSSSSSSSGGISIWTAVDSFTSKTYYDTAGSSQDLPGEYKELPMILGASVNYDRNVYLYGQMRYLSTSVASSSGSAAEGSGVGDVNFGLRLRLGGWTWDLGMNYDMRADKETAEGEAPISDKWHALYLGVRKGWYTSGLSFGVGVEINTFLERELKGTSGSSSDTVKATAGTLYNVWVQSGLSLGGGVGVAVRLGRLGQANTVANEKEVDKTGGSLWYLTPSVTYALSRTLSVRLAADHRGAYTNWGIPLSGENWLGGIGWMASVSLYL